MNANASNNRWIVVVLAALLVVFTVIIACGAGALGGYLIARQEFERKAEALQGIQPAITVVPEREPSPVLPELFGNRGGALIQEVVAGSPADSTGLRAGDLITAVEGEAVTLQRSLSDLILQYEPGDEITLAYVPHTSPNRAEQEVTVILGQAPDDPALPYLGVFFRPFFPGLELEEQQSD